MPSAAATGDPIRIVDLFSGCGGLTLGALEGARRAGRPSQLDLAVDVDPVPLDVLKSTLLASESCFSTVDLGKALSADPMRAATPAEEELFEHVPAGALLLAGPPCQGHSALNNHTRHDDPRNDLYLAVGRVARLIDARAAIVENVGGVGSDRRASMSRCAAALEQMGYFVRATRLNLNAIGVPQKRIRHLLVATKNRPLSWAVPPIPGRTTRWAIEDLLEDLLGDDETTPFDTPSRSSRVNRERIDWLFDNDAYDLPNELRPKCHRSDHSYVSMYGRLRWDSPAQTITSGFGSIGQGRFIHPLRRRVLTPHEAARLQFLPDFVRFGEVGWRTDLAQMIGNVAPPRLSMSLVEALVEQGLL